MKNNTPLVFTALSLAAVAPFQSAFAADLYWGSDTTGGDTADFTSWQDSSHWFQDAGGVTGATGVPGASDNAIFSVTSLNATALVPRIFSNTTVNAITFKNTATFNLTGGGNRDLIIGGGGVTKDVDTASATFGTSTSNRNVFVRFQADQTWTNNSSTTLLIRNSATSAVGAGNVVATFNAAGSGGISNSGAYSDNTDSTFGIIVDSTGTGVVGIQNSAYSGGTTIKRGILQANGAGIGTAAVKLGDTTGSAAATLRVSTTASVTTALTVQAGNTGVNTLEFSNTSGTYGADITLDNDLHVGVRQSGATGVTINGVISGAGDLIKGQYQGGNSQVLTLAGANTYTGDTIITNGGFTLAETGGLTFSIGADGVNNQVAGTSGGAILFGGAFSFVFDGEAFADGNSWVIVDKSGLTNTSFAATFSVSGFDEVDDIWTNASGFTFSEDTGVLSYAAVPESSTYAALAGLGALGFVASRRRRSV